MHGRLGWMIISLILVVLGWKRLVFWFTRWTIRNGWWPMSMLNALTTFIADGMHSSSCIDKIMGHFQRDVISLFTSSGNIEIGRRVKMSRSRSNSSGTCGRTEQSWGRRRSNSQTGLRSSRTWGEWGTWWWNRSWAPTSNVDSTESTSVRHRAFCCQWLETYIFTIGVNEMLQFQSFIAGCTPIMRHNIWIPRTDRLPSTIIAHMMILACLNPEGGFLKIVSSKRHGWRPWKTSASPTALPHHLLLMRFRMGGLTLCWV